MKRLLMAGLTGLGAAALAIGAGVFLFGPASVAGFCASLLRLEDSAGAALAAPDVDNEMRFYAVFWMAYGAITIHAARNLPVSLGRVRILLALFFAGGVGRALSVVGVGAPHPLFATLMWIELIAAPALFLMSLTFKPAAAR